MLYPSIRKSTDTYIPRLRSAFPPLYRSVPDFLLLSFQRSRDQGGLHAHSDIDRDIETGAPAQARPNDHEVKRPPPVCSHARQAIVPCPFCSLIPGLTVVVSIALYRANDFVGRGTWTRQPGQAANGRQQQPGRLLVVLLVVRVGICRRMAIRLVSGQTEAAALSVSTTRSGIDQ